MVFILNDSQFGFGHSTTLVLSEFGVLSTFDKGEMVSLSLCAFNLDECNIEQNGPQWTNKIRYVL